MFIKLPKYATNNLLELPESASLEILIITLCIFLIIYTLYALLTKMRTLMDTHLIVIIILDIS